MKKWVILIGAGVVLLGAVYFTLSLYAVKFIEAELQRKAGPGLTVTAISVRPTHLSVKGIRYEDPLSKQLFFNIEETRIYPDILAPLKGSLRLREWVVLRPTFFFQRSREGDWVGPWVSLKKEKEENGKSITQDDKGEEPLVEVQIGRLRIHDGSVRFEDKKTGSAPARIELEALNFTLGNIRYPLVSARSPVELEGKVKGTQKDGRLQLTGWLDLNRGDMETSLNLSAVEIKTFEPYYRRQATAEIESGQIGMESKISVKERRIDAPGSLELTDLQIKEGDGTIFWVPAKYLVSLLKKKENRIRVKFHVKGNMEDPEFDVQEQFLNRVVLSLAEALGIPIKVVGEKAFEGTLKGTEGLTEGLKSIGELFKRKKEKKRGSPE